MSHARATPMSLDEFLAWERAQDTKWEFDGTAPVAMTGGTVRHRLIADTLRSLLAPQLPPGCRALAGDVKIIVAGRVRYPDLIVVCGLIDLTGEIAPDPTVVVEILSASTARTDRFLKLEEYRRTPSIQHFLLLEQTSRDGLLFSRVGETFAARAVGPEDTVSLAALGMDFKMADLYADSGLESQSIHSLPPPLTVG